MPNLAQCGDMVTYNGSNFSGYDKNPDTLNIGTGYGVQTMDFTVANNAKNWCRITIDSDVTQQGLDNGKARMSVNSGVNLIF